MPIKYRKNSTTYSLVEYDSTDHTKEIGAPIMTHVVGSIKFEIKGTASYNPTSSTFSSPNGWLKVTQGNSIKVNELTTGRGVTLYILSPDLLLQEKTQYDTYANGTSALVSKLTTINKNFVYVLTSCDANTMDTNLKNCLNTQFGCNITTTYSQQRRGFALLYAGGSCAFSFSSSTNSANAYTVLTRYLRSTNYVLSNMQSSEQANNYDFSLNNFTNYETSKTYYIRVRFRTRGDGNSTSSKCSSVGFITWNKDWKRAYSMIHNSFTAYNERGRIVDCTWSFKPDQNFINGTVINSQLFFIIGNAWANGYDNQTIDLYYYKFWSVDGSGNETVIAQSGIGGINVGRYGYTSYQYSNAICSYFLGYKKNNKIYYSLLHPTIINNSYGSQSKTICEQVSTSISTIKYYYSSGWFNAYINNTNYKGLTVSKTYIKDNKTISYNIPAGTYTPSNFQNMISQFVSANGTRKSASQFTATVNNQSQTFNAGITIYYRVGYSISSSGSSRYGSWNFVNFGSGYDYGLTSAMKFTATYCTYTCGSTGGILDWWRNANSYNITITPGINFQ